MRARHEDRTRTCAPTRSSSPSGARASASSAPRSTRRAWDVAALAARWRELKPAQVYILIGTTRSKAKSDAVQGNIYEQVDSG